MIIESRRNFGFKRHRRGLETCQQANLVQNVHSATTLFTSLHRKK